HGAAMRAGIEESVNRAGAIAIEDQLAAADRTGDEVAIADNLGGMAEIEPATVEDGLALGLEHGLVGEGPPRDAEQVPAAILDDHLRSGQDGVHDFLLRLPWTGL